MEAARLVLDPASRVGPVDRRLFGSFVEHMGRAVYGGIYEPGHPTADADGFRTDVLDLVRELGPTIVRYPGGNFVSGYRWEDGVGPREGRPRRLDLAWRSIETNEIGLNEFVRWTRAAGVEPMVVVNLGTRGIEAACDLLEYANHPGGTALSDLRRAHGEAEPHGIRTWCLGNEMDGPWQVGHKTADEYGRLAAETARAMRLVDPSIELVACGSSGSTMPTFGAWEATVLEHTYELVDYLSMHAYYEEVDGDLGTFLASAVDLDRSIEAVVAIIDRVAARVGSRKLLRIAFDEWNVWYMRRFDGRQGADWSVAPAIIEDDYSVADAVVVGDLLLTLLRHADRVAIACLAQLVNVIAPIRTITGGPAWRQTTFHPFGITARHARGVVLRPVVRCPTYATQRFGDVPVLNATAVLDEDAEELVIFAVNRSIEEPLPLTVELHGFEHATVVEVQTVTSDDPRATNGPGTPDRAVPVRGAATIVGGALATTLPPVSWSVIRVKVR
jgi:alpha-N-arabinofuranosidase